MDELRNIVSDLERFDADDDDEIVVIDSAVVECLRLGLPLLEAKYGLSSQEADIVRAIIADHE
ncbi:MAG: hypothetical protein JST38_08870 [Bacteroidetes bacterium]|nr:hypothetical protein [Bacteroidota bacterium]